MTASACHGAGGESRRDARILLAGFGGQGVLFAGKIIATTGLLENREVSWLPSYGPEMRGGTANCSVCLSNEPIGSPLVVNPDIFLVLNQPSYDKFLHDVVPEGLVVADTTLIPFLNPRNDVDICGIPATKLAEEAGLAGLSNMILIGHLFAKRPFCEAETLEAAVKQCIPPRKAALLDKNLEAIEIGRTFHA